MMFGDLNTVVTEVHYLRKAVEDNTKEANELRQELIKCQETLKDICVTLSKRDGDETD